MNYNTYRHRSNNDIGNFSVLIDDPSLIQVLQRISIWNNDILEFWYKIKIDNKNIIYIVNTSGFVYIGDPNKRRKQPTPFRIDLNLLKL